MTKEKLFILLTYSISIGYLGSMFRLSVKIMDPILIIVWGGIYQKLFAILIILSLIYLFVSAIFFPYQKWKIVTTVAIFILTLSVIREFFHFDKFLLGEKIYIIITSILFFISIYYLIRSYKEDIK